MVIDSSPNSGFFNGVEFINYSQHNLVVVDNAGIEVEISAGYDNSACFQDRGKLIVRVNKYIDPRKVTIKDINHKYLIDQRYISEFKTKIEALKNNYRNGLIPNNTELQLVQIELRFDFSDINTIIESDIIGFSVRAEANKNSYLSTNTSEDDIKRYFIPTVEELDKNSVDYEEVRKTVCAVRLVDRTGVVGDLYTNVFGTVVRIVPLKDGGLKDGLYVTAGFMYEKAVYIPLTSITKESLRDLNLHRTVYDAQNSTQGDYVKPLEEKINRLNKEADEQNKKLNKANNDNKDLQTKLNLEAQKNIVAIRDLKNKHYDNLHKQGTVIEDLRKTNNRLTDETIRLKNEYKDELNELRRKQDRQVEELKDNKNNNNILEGIKITTATIGLILGFGKFFMALK